MNKIKVLYIDDEVINLKAFEASFRRMFKIYTASSAEAGEEILREHNIEVVIADQRMPGKTGVDFFESILNLHPAPMRILLTAYSDINAIIDAINRGNVYRYVTKPWNEYDLKLTIENAYQLYLLKEQNNKLNTKYKKVFTESTDPILLFNTKWQIVDYNMAAIEMLDASENYLNNTLFSSIIEDSGESQRVMTALEEGSVVKDFECQIRSKKDKIIDVLMSVNSIKNNHNNIVGYQAILKDITIRSRMNKMLLKTIIETQEFERERIAKDLHDGLGQTLAAVKLHFSGMNKPISTEDEDYENYSKIDELLNHSIKLLRKICYDALPSVLSEYGIITAVEELCNKTSSKDFKIDIENDGKVPRLDKALEIAVYRIIQEFLNNTIKHGEATQVNISIKNENDNLLLNLTDNGKGFNVNNLMIYKGQGLKNIKSRVDSFNGRINFNSEINGGTKFNISIPFSMN